jgi:hypothetical protein
MRIVVTPGGRDSLAGSALGRALRWKPRTHRGVWVVAAGCGTIYFAGQSVYPVWSLRTRLALALALVALGVARGSMKLRRRLHDQQWSASHPISLNRHVKGALPDSDHLATGMRDHPDSQQV